MSALADTHLLLWHFEGKGRLSAQQQKAIASATPADPLLVADISLWEIASLVELGRVRLGIPLRDGLDRAMAPPLVRCIGISPAIRRPRSRRFQPRSIGTPRTGSSSQRHA